MDGWMDAYVVPHIWTASPAKDVISLGMEAVCVTALVTYGYTVLSLRTFLGSSALLKVIFVL